MAGSVNKVILVGNLGKDPEVRSMQSGDKVCSFSIATSESWKDKTSGERQERTQWHNVVIWNQPLVKVAESYLKKGSKVYIEGQLETRKWEKDGVDRYTTEVVLRPFRGEMTLLDSKGSSGGGGYQQDQGDSSQSYGAPAGRSASNTSTAPARVDELEDEIPF